MINSQFIASVHTDYLAFIQLTTDEQLGQFIRAQIRQSLGEQIPELTGITKALYDAHNALIERLEESRRKKSDAGKRGGNPALKSSTPNKCLSSDKAALKPDTVSITDTDTITNKISLSMRGSDKQKKYSDEADEMRLSKLLFERIKQNSPCYKEPNFQAWCRHIDLMLRIDKRPPAEIEDVIDFSQSDSFWRTVVLSTNILRKQFDQLIIKMRTVNANGSSKTVYKSTERYIDEPKSQYGNVV